MLISNYSSLHSITKHGFPVNRTFLGKGLNYFAIVIDIILQENVNVAIPEAL